MQAKHVLIPYIPMLVPPKKWKGYEADWMPFILYISLGYLSWLLHHKIFWIWIISDPGVLKGNCRLHHISYLIYFATNHKYVMEILAGMIKVDTYSYLRMSCVLMDQVDNKMPWRTFLGNRCRKYLRFGKLEFPFLRTWNFKHIAHLRSSLVF